MPLGLNSKLGALIQIALEAATPDVNYFSTYAPPLVPRPECWAYGLRQALTCVSHHNQAGGELAYRRGPTLIYRAAGFWAALCATHHWFVTNAAGLTLVTPAGGAGGVWFADAEGVGAYYAIGGVFNVGTIPAFTVAGDPLSIVTDVQIVFGYGDIPETVSVARVLGRDWQYWIGADDSGHWGAGLPIVSVNVPRRSGDPLAPCPGGALHDGKQIGMYSGAGEVLSLHHQYGENQGWQETYLTQPVTDASRIAAEIVLCAGDSGQPSFLALTADQVILLSLNTQGGVPTWLYGYALHDAINAAIALIPNNGGATLTAADFSKADIMLLSEARTHIGKLAKNRADDPVSYQTDEIDMALAEALFWADQNSNITQRKDSITLTASDSTLPTMPTGFRVELLNRAALRTQNVDLNRVDHATIKDKLENDTNAGQPAYIGFDEQNTGHVYPTPDAVETYIVDVYWRAYATWSYGQTDSTTNGTSLLLHDMHMIPLLRGAAGYVLSSSATSDGGEVGERMIKRFEEYCEKNKGAGNLGAQVHVRKRPGARVAQTRPWGEFP